MYFPFGSTWMPTQFDSEPYFLEIVNCCFQCRSKVIVAIIIAATVAIAIIIIIMSHKV